MGARNLLSIESKLRVSSLSVADRSRTTSRRFFHLSRIDRGLYTVAGVDTLTEDDFAFYDSIAPDDVL